MLEIDTTFQFEKLKDQLMRILTQTILILRCHVLTGRYLHPGVPGARTRRAATGTVCFAWIWARLRTVDSTRQCPYLLLVELNKSTAFKTTWQHHGAVTYANQTTYGMSYRLKHTPDLPVTPLGQGDLVPTVRTLAAARLN